MPYVTKSNDSFWIATVKGKEVLIDRCFSSEEAERMAACIAADGRLMNCSKQIAERVKLPPGISSTFDECVFINFIATAHHAQQIQLRPFSEGVNYIV